MKTAAIYARVSSDKQKEENTISSQTAALTAFAAEQGYAVPTEWIFEDEGYSLQPRGGDEAHDQRDVQVGIEPPRALDRAFRWRRFAVPRQIERYQPVMFDNARVGHQPMKLPTVGSGGVHA